MPTQKSSKPSPRSGKNTAADAVRTKKPGPAVRRPALSAARVSDALAPQDKAAPKRLVQSAGESTARTFHTTEFGEMILGDSLKVLAAMPERSVDLIMTSPPFGLVRKKAYGNVDADEYLEWFRPFGQAFKRVLKKSGSLVIDLGGAWVPGQPTRSLYHLKLPIMLCEDLGFHLAQEFYWWNPSKLPTPAEWVTVRRVRVKDAVNCVWWLSSTPWPKASNTRVLQPYSDSMLDLLKNGYKAKLRPSGHDISTKFSVNNGASIPPNLIAMANTESNGRYQRYCSEQGLKPHPARYPATLPEYFIRMLTDSGDLVVDPFAGSCVTGEVCERLGRRWRCVELQEDYLRGAIVRFEGRSETAQLQMAGVEGTPARGDSGEAYYKIARPGLNWNGTESPRLYKDGGKKRRVKTKPAPKKPARSDVAVEEVPDDGLDEVQTGAASMAT